MFRKPRIKSFRCVFDLFHARGHTDDHQVANVSIPHLRYCPRRSLPPVERLIGVSPNQAAKSLPHLNCSAPPIVVTMADSGDRPNASDCLKQGNSGFRLCRLCQVATIPKHPLMQGRELFAQVDDGAPRNRRKVRDFLLGCPLREADCVVSTAEQKPATEAVQKSASIGRAP